MEVSPIIVSVETVSTEVPGKVSDEGTTVGAAAANPISTEVLKLEENGKHDNIIADNDNLPEFRDGPDERSASDPDSSDDDTNDSVRFTEIWIHVTCWQSVCLSCLVVIDKVLKMHSTVYIVEVALLY